MTTYSTDGARDALAGLVGTGAAIPLTDPVLVGLLLDGARQAYADIRKENAELLGRLHAIRQTVFPLLRNPGIVGDLARTIEAEADPHGEPQP